MKWTFLWGEKSLRSSLPVVVERSIPPAYSLWESVLSIADLPSVFERVMSYRKDNGQFSYANLVQPGLAHAFTLAKVGQPEAAARMLENYPLLKGLNERQNHDLRVLLAAAVT